MLVRVLVDNGVEEVEVAEKETFVFLQGIVGFEERTRYALFELEEPYYLLQSTGDPHVGFVLAPPSLSQYIYNPVLSDEDKDLLELDTDDPIDFLCVVTLSGSGKPETMNMRAPVAFNRNKMKGAQVILQDSKYPVRYPIPCRRDPGGIENRSIVQSYMAEDQVSRQRWDGC